MISSYSIILFFSLGAIIQIAPVIFAVTQSGFKLGKFSIFLCVALWLPCSIHQNFYVYCIISFLSILFILGIGINRDILFQFLPKTNNQSVIFYNLVLWAMVMDFIPLSAWSQLSDIARKWVALFSMASIISLIIGFQSSNTLVDNLFNYLWYLFISILLMLFNVFYIMHDPYFFSTNSFHSDILAILIGMILVNVIIDLIGLISLLPEFQGKMESNEDYQIRAALRDAEQDKCIQKKFVETPTSSIWMNWGLLLFFFAIFIPNYIYFQMDNILWIDLFFYIWRFCSWATRAQKHRGLGMTN
jgi:hypothetical protein